MISQVPIFAMLGVVGEVCGMILGFAGNLIRGMMERGKKRGG